MLNKLVTTAVRIVEGIAGIAGIRVGTEEPHYLCEKLDSGVEIRRYGPRIAAETTVDGDEEAARSAGFRRLAGYIFGGNHQKTSIAMTAPVAQQRTQIAMTAPVAQARENGSSVIRFFMPSKWSMETLPQPDDDSVRLVEVPAEAYGVLRFSGDRGPAAVAQRTEELRGALRAAGYDADGPAVAWFYDPPWTLPFARRNEVAIPVSV